MKGTFLVAFNEELFHQTASKTVRARHSPTLCAYSYRNIAVQIGGRRMRDEKHAHLFTYTVFLFFFNVVVTLKRYTRLL